MDAPTFTTNLGRIGDFGLLHRPDKVALIQHDLELTYRELDARTNQVANGLLAAGVAAGDRVLIVWENDIRFVEVTLGAIRAGAVAVPVNPKLAPEAHRQLLDDSGAQIVLASRSSLPSARQLADAPAVRLAIGVGGDGPVAEYESWLQNSSAQLVDIAVDPAGLAWLAYTSGSTGRPKGVMIPHHMLLRDAQLITQTCFITSADRAIIATPLFHMNAAACGILPSLYAGASAYLLPAFDPIDVLRGIEERRATYCIGVPAMYKLMMAHADELSLDYRSLRLIACGSAPMPLALIERLSEVFPNARFTEGYGLTECGPAATLVPPYGVARPGSIGLPLPGFEARIVGADGDLAAGATGELWLRSSCTSLGYLDRPEEDAKRRRPDGWLATGDLAVMDDDGYLYFRGRADDMMNVGGENVYPAEVEGILARHPAVRDVAVVPVPHETKGEVPVAFVVCEPGANLGDDELRTFFLANGPAYAHPRRVTLLPAMPLAATGKTDRQQLTALARDAVTPSR